MKKHAQVGCLSLFACAGIAASAVAQTIHPEVEPNDTKAQALANGLVTLSIGDGFSGVTTGSSTTAGGALNSADTFFFRTTAMPLGIYRHRLSVDLVNTSATLRGMTQSNGVPNPSGDSSAQFGTTANGVARSVVWYGFGRQEQVYYRVTGTSATTATYTATLQASDPVTPTPIGVDFQSGDIEITTKGTGALADSHLWVFDSNFNIVPGFGNNDQPSPGSGVRSRLTRTFAPGNYYLAISMATLVTNHAAPSDERSRNTPLFDHGDIIATSSGSTNKNLTFWMTDQFGPVVTNALIPSGSAGAFNVLWYSFTVGAATGTTGACCLPDGTCAILRDVGCTTRGGVFGGSASVCATQNCDQPGACCVPMEGCASYSSSQCATAAGVYSGNGTLCATSPCATAVKRVASFTPDLTHLFPGSGTFASFPAFNNTATFSSTATTGTPLLCTGGWGFECSISASGLASPTPAIMASTNGGVVIDFSTPIKNFGVYVGSNTPTGNRCTFEFFDAGGSLGIDDLNEFDNDCGWSFAAYESTVPLTRVIIRGSYPGVNGGYVQMTLPQITYFGQGCYPNCDNSTQAPVLNVQDFSCFLTRYAAGESYANCDNSTQAPVLNVQDFSCFLTSYAAGCP